MKTLKGHWTDGVMPYKKWKVIEEQSYHTAWENCHQKVLNSFTVQVRNLHPLLDGECASIALCSLNQFESQNCFMNTCFFFFFNYTVVVIKEWVKVKGLHVDSVLHTECWLRSLEYSLSSCNKWTYTQFRSWANFMFTPVYNQWMKTAKHSQACFFCA